MKLPLQRFLSLLVVLTTTALTRAQKNEAYFSVWGQLTGESNKYEQILAQLKTPGGTLVESEWVEADGRFRLEKIRPGNYYLEISQDQKKLYVGAAFTVDQDLDLKQIQLVPAAEELKEVVIQKNKPYIERQQGKTILNVAQSISAAGASALEVLEKAPGIRIDQNDNISMRRSNSIAVQIDGKPIQMSGTNLAGYLRGIPANSIDKIEFITNPSAQYDAAGSSIINIKMKKEKKKGTHLGLNVSAGSGDYPKINSGISANQRGQKYNLFGSYNQSYREGFNELTLQRKFIENQQFAGAYEQDNFLKINLRNHVGRLGIDYQINPRHSWGLLLSGVDNGTDLSGNNQADVLNNQASLTSRFKTASRTFERFKNRAVNVNHKYVIDTLGTEIATDVDWAEYVNHNQQNFNTDYFDLNQQPYKPRYKLFGNLDGILKMSAAKSDFSTQLQPETKLESGLKASYVKADNSLAFYNMSSGSGVLDPNKSNHFIYEENIYAAYAVISKKIGAWKLQGGLRGEATKIKGRQLVGQQSFDDDYVQWFPSGSVAYKPNELHSVEFNYSRRIQRPSYDQLNPFKFYLDETTYKTGNPRLQPQTTQSVECTYGYQEKFFATLSFSRTQKVITESIAPSETEERVTVQTTRNLDRQDVYGLFLMVPLELRKGWEMNSNLNVYWSGYTGTVSGTALNNSGQFTWNLNMTHNFNLGNNLTAELTANYQAPERYAFDQVRALGFVNVGLQKKFNNQSTLKFSAADLFKTNRIEATTQFNNYREHFLVVRDTRVFMLSYTYSWGNGKNSGPRKSGAADDLKRRVGNGNG